MDKAESLDRENQVNEMVNKEVNKNMLDIGEILRASFGEASSKIKVTFKKSVKVRDYEIETFEGENEIVLDKAVSNGERLFISALARAQIEFEIYSRLYIKGVLTTEEYTKHKKSIEQTVNSLKVKAENELGISLDKYIKNT